jgi:hypothetical protein
MTTRPGRCPACERFIGPLELCPYCDCPSERRAGLRLLRALAVLLAVGGLLLLALAVRQPAVPSIAAGSIVPSMNFARVRVAGALATTPRSGHSRTGNAWVNFMLEDGTGRIRVSAFGQTAERLLPRLAGAGTGALCRAEGWLSVRAGQPPSLQIRDPEALDLRGEQ